MKNNTELSVSHIIELWKVQMLNMEDFAANTSVASFENICIDNSMIGNVDDINDINDVDDTDLDKELLFG